MDNTDILSEWSIGSVWAFITIGLAIVLILTGLACAVVRVSRTAAIVLLLCGSLPVVAGVAGMVHSQVRARHTVETLKAPTPANLREGDFGEGRINLLLGIAAMLMSETAAVAALVRSRRPGEAAQRSAV